jgi:hypothetical protein
MENGFGHNRTQDADDTPFDITGTTYPPSVLTVGDALRNITSISIDALTEFEAFESDAEESTTSNRWVTKSGYPYTTITKSAGDYVINFTAQVGQSDKEKTVGSRVQFRLGTSGTWITIKDIRDAVSTDDAFQLRTGFFIITLPVDGVFQVRQQFGQTDDGGTGKIKEANITIGKVAE